MSQLHAYIRERYETYAATYGSDFTDELSWSELNSFLKTPGEDQNLIETMESIVEDIEDGYDE